MRKAPSRREMPSIAEADLPDPAEPDPVVAEKPAPAAPKQTYNLSAISSDKLVAELFPKRKPFLAQLVQRQGPMLALLLTSTGMALFSQLVADQDMADNSVQVLAFVKFGAAFLAALIAEWRAQDSTSRKLHFSREQYILMTMIGLLDVFSYAMNTIGFVLCGAATATLILAGTQQVFTAALSHFWLNQKLTRPQAASVSLVVLGLVVRAAAPMPSQQESATGGHQRLVGVFCMLLSSLGYSFLGVSYDLLVRSDGVAPTHNQLVLHVASIGLACNTLFQAMYTLPRWQALVTEHLQHSGTPAWYAVALLLSFGAYYNVHNYIQGLVYRSEGALGVGLVTAVRGATVSVAANAMYCSAAAPWQCLTRWTGASAAIVTLGGITWVAGTAKKPRPLVRKASSRLQVLISQRSMKQALVSQRSFRANLQEDVTD
eukprot:jgi/Astpho2/5339/Aster-x0676